MLIYKRRGQSLRGICEQNTKIGEVKKHGSSPERILNLVYSKTVTILELTEMVRDAIAKLTNDEINPQIKIVDISKAMKFLGIEKLIELKKSINDIVRSRLQRRKL